MSVQLAPHTVQIDNYTHTHTHIQESDFYHEPTWASPGSSPRHGSYPIPKPGVHPSFGAD